MRQVLTSRFPCIKTHWYHPLCVPASELRIVEQFGSRDGAPFTLQSECVGAEALPVEEQELISLALQQQQQQQQQQPQQQQQQQQVLPAAFTEVGRRMPAVAKKRKRASEDAEYLPASLALSQNPCWKAAICSSNPEKERRARRSESRHEYRRKVRSEGCCGRSFAAWRSRPCCSLRPRPNLRLVALSSLAPPFLVVVQVFLILLLLSLLWLLVSRQGAPFT